METVILNIDSNQIPNVLIGSNGFDFKYMRDSNNNSSFNTIDNVVSIKLTNLKCMGHMHNYANENTLHDTNGLIDIHNSFLRKINYRFLTINNFKFIKGNNSTYNEYTTKLMFYPSGEFTGTVVASPDIIKFEQPQSLKDLRFRFFLENGNIPSRFTNDIHNDNNKYSILSDGTEFLPQCSSEVDPETAAGTIVYKPSFSFTLEITRIKNSMLKNYNEMFTFSPEVLQNMAYQNMINSSKSISTNQYSMNQQQNYNNHNMVHNTNTINYGGNIFENK